MLMLLLFNPPPFSSSACGARREMKERKLIPCVFIDQNPVAPPGNPRSNPCPPPPPSAVDRELLLQFFLFGMQVFVPWAEHRRPNLSTY